MWYRTTFPALVPLLPTLMSGATVYAQYLWLDACGSQGFSASNTLTITLQ